MERTRRELLGLTGLAATGVASGCLGGLGGSSTDAGETRTGAGTDRTPTPNATASLPPGLARVDRPPYEIDEPACDDPDEGRDPRYLCANMATNPSIPFTQAWTRGNFLGESGISYGDATQDDQIYATLLTEDASRVDGPTDEGPTELIRGTDFESHAVLVIQTGFGSGSFYPHIVRLERTEAGIHAFGCQNDPCVYTDDIAIRTTAVRFPRQEPVQRAVASLTVAPDERWNVVTGEGVVTVGNS